MGRLPGWRIAFKISNSHWFPRTNVHHFVRTRFAFSFSTLLSHKYIEPIIQKLKITVAMTMHEQHFEKFDHELAPAMKNKVMLPSASYGNKNRRFDLPPSSASQTSSSLSSRTKICICHWEKFSLFIPKNYIYGTM